MPTKFDTPEMRELLASRSSAELVAAQTHATLNTLVDNAELHPAYLPAAIRSCEYSTVAITLIWLQERGVIIPADACAFFNIDDVRPAHA